MAGHRTFTTSFAGIHPHSVAEAERMGHAAPASNPAASLITGVICGIRVEEIDDPLIQRIRYPDEPVDEVARGKKRASILRSPAQPERRRESHSMFE
jgi:hypothetical protein